VATDVSTILDAVRAKVEALALEHAGVPIPVVKRKVTKAERDVDARTQITVVKSTDPETIDYFTNVHDLYGVILDVALVGPGNADQLTDLATWTAARRAILAAFARKPADHLGLPNLWRVRAIPGEFLEPANLRANYDVTVARVLVQTYEVR
jgi:hypothetical protein